MSNGGDGGTAGGSGVGSIQQGADALSQLASTLSTIQKIIDDLGGFGLGSRSVVCEIDNVSGHTLDFDSNTFDHGGFGPDLPPASVAGQSSGLFSARSTGVATGWREESSTLSMTVPGADLRYISIILKLAAIVAIVVLTVQFQTDTSRRRSSAAVTMARACATYLVGSTHRSVLERSLKMQSQLVSTPMLRWLVSAASSRRSPVSDP